jgi:hypothetical protein
VLRHNPGGLLVLQFSEGRSDVRTKFRLSVLLAALIALAVLVSGSTAAYANGGKVKKLRLTADQIQFATTIGEPPSLGQELVFSETLFKRGREVGQSGVVCTVVQATPPYDTVSLHCVGTLSLRKGQITLQGLIELQGLNDPGPFKVAITGGTGKFKCAGGQATYRQTSATTAVYKLKIQDFCKHKKHKKHKRHHH